MKLCMSQGLYFPLSHSMVVAFFASVNSPNVKETLLLKNLVLKTFAL